jgi:6-pyruvoyltetrahydropterin/6-carboxytetrahydropterin synthase
MDWLKQFSPQREGDNSREPVQLPVTGFAPSEPHLVQRAMATGMAYELAMDSFFGASHAIRPTGETHTHSFRIQATFVTDSVDENGMICGFREVSDLLDFEAKRYVNRFINDIKPFDVVQPTGENLATVIYRNLLTSLSESMPGGPELVSVTLWENPTSSVRVGMWRAA